MRGVAALGVSLDDPLARTWYAAFLDEMKKLGWVEGQNLRLDFRPGYGDADQTRAYAAPTQSPNRKESHATAGFHRGDRRERSVMAADGVGAAAAEAGGGLSEQPDTERGCQYAPRFRDGLKQTGFLEGSTLSI